ncbi:hypothetical protein SAMN05660691_01620 [Rheinheimera pacifica]|uniref:Uncharacterized protein n=1 Tax=Rheinheimera pacifica TaxID=173990 RepID=A0A1H6L9U3_9GAMM|nr:hypothetical protein SAMN05660691_01620 [Rheinheimera pacifica]
MHDRHLTLEAAIEHVESRRLEVLHMPPWTSERDEKLKENIMDTYFLEILFLQLL